MQWVNTSIHYAPYLPVVAGAGPPRGVVPLIISVAVAKALSVAVSVARGGRARGVPEGGRVVVCSHDVYVMLTPTSQNACPWSNQIASQLDSQLDSQTAR
jgi:hypothetical protein